MICHLDITSIALHKDSEEAKQQIQREEGVFDGNLIFGILIVLHVKSFVTNHMIVRLPKKFFLEGSEESRMRRASMKVINKNKVVNVLKGRSIFIISDVV